MTDRDADGARREGARRAPPRPPSVGLCACPRVGDTASIARNEGTTQFKCTSAVRVPRCALHSDSSLTRRHRTDFVALTTH